jgi:peptidoglycan LD-endopeptidase LytH
MEGIAKILVWILIVVVVIAGLVAWLAPPNGLRLPGTGIHSLTRDQRVISYIRNPERNPEWAVKSGQRCGQAPFQMPTDGFIGYLWDDSFRPGHRHSGLDIFGGSAAGDTPVYAAHDGYLTRLPEWRSSLIIRIPQDPLDPNRQIWTYYTHMADHAGNDLISADYPPGTQEVFVQAGTLLGHQGNFSGTPGSPVGVHLHFSIVRDDGMGRFLNEMDIENSLDPSPYLGLNLNANTNKDEIPVCPPGNESQS